MTCTCAYCGNPADLVTGNVIYPHRPDLEHKHFWRCVPCKAHVGCHPGRDGRGTQPLGRLANAALRRAKSQAHAAFDPIWRDGSMKRKEAYAWLASAMGMNKSKCHIGEFDVEQCIAAIAAVQQIKTITAAPPAERVKP